MTMETFGESLSRMRATFRSGKTKDVRFRRKQLEALMKLYEECREEIVDVLAADLRWFLNILKRQKLKVLICRRPKQESIVFDVDIMTNELRNILHNLDNWTSPKKVAKSTKTAFLIALKPSKCNGLLIFKTARSHDFVWRQLVA